MGGGADAELSGFWLVRLWWGALTHSLLIGSIHFHDFAVNTWLFETVNEDCWKKWRMFYFIKPLWQKLLTWRYLDSIFYPITLNFIQFYTFYLLNCCLEIFCDCITNIQRFLFDCIFIFPATLIKYLQVNPYIFFNKKRSSNSFSEL